MRPVRLVGLAVLWLLLLRPAFAQHPPRHPRLLPPVPTHLTGMEPGQSKSFQAEGVGATSEEAKQDALSQVRNEVLEYLRSQGLALQWPPPESYFWTLKKDFDDHPRDMPQLGQVREVRLRVEVNEDNVRDILRQDRGIRAEHRMLTLGKILGSLVALCIAVAGYFRLEEATKGYYTGWLRLGAVGFVSAVGFGLWLVS